MDSGRVGFGRFEFEPRLGRLTRDGHRIKLQPKASAVLCRLLRNPGDVVSRDDLRKALWPEGTHVDFDLGIKVAVQKLRAALRDVVEEPTYIQTVPGVGYRFIAQVTAVEPDTTVGPTREVGPAQHFRRRRELVWASSVATSLGVTVLAIASYRAIVYSRSELPDPVVTPFTSNPGHETDASFSPDGNRIAFSWNGPHEDNFDIYVKQIGPGDQQRLTSTPEWDNHPRWSPDGKWIAFLRHGGPGPGRVMAIPATGGPEHTVAEPNFNGSMTGTLDWSPDGKWLLFTTRSAADRGTGLTLISFETGEIRQITSPAGAEPDYRGSFAPDGHAIAFLRYRARQNRLMVLGLSRSLEPVGTATEISFPKTITAVCWTADSRDLVVAAGDSEDSQGLWRVPSSGNSPPRLLSYAGGSAFFPAVSRQGNRMAFARWSRESHFEALELDSKGQPTGPSAKVFASTRIEYSPRFSRDGSRVVFQSSRSGGSAIWVCESAGTNCSPVSPPGLMAVNPDWSPDGKWIAFNTNSESGSEIDLVRSDGGKPKFLTRGTTEFNGAMVPRWSGDGKWIYFECGAYAQVCRVASSGGAAQPVPGAAGWFADESPDGRWLYFSTGGDIKPGQLKRVPVSGGAATEIVSHVWGRNWAVSTTGVWYMAPRGNDLRYLDLATGAARTVFRTEKPVLAGLAVSPDQRRILFSQGKEPPESDIMLVDNFR